MSWVSDYQYTFVQKLAFRALQLSGHIPHHIAFVMDGNRRFARSEQIDKIEGHSRGFAKLADVLRWCLDMGIREVTTFAFSIENFKRSNEEVEGIFNLAREKFHKLLEETSRMDEHGIRIRVIGNIELLPVDLQRLIATAMLRTESNDKLFLNIAFAYTSHDEITQAVESVLKVADTEDKDSADCALLLPSDVNERLLEACLYTRHSSPPDLVFRTSGETRLSDFMMWQVGACLTIPYPNPSMTKRLLFLLCRFAALCSTSQTCCGPRSPFGTSWPALLSISGTGVTWRHASGRSGSIVSNWPSPVISMAKKFKGFCTKWRKTVGNYL